MSLRVWLRKRKRAFARIDHSVAVAIARHRAHEDGTGAVLGFVPTLFASFAEWSSPVAQFRNMHLAAEWRPWRLKKRSPVPSAPPEHPVGEHDQRAVAPREAALESGAA